MCFGREFPFEWKCNSRGSCVSKYDEDEMSTFNVLDPESKKSWLLLLWLLFLFLLSLPAAAFESIYFYSLFHVLSPISNYLLAVKVKADSKSYELHTSQRSPETGSQFKFLFLLSYTFSISFYGNIIAAENILKLIFLPQNQVKNRTYQWQEYILCLCRREMLNCSTWTLTFNTLIDFLFCKRWTARHKKWGTQRVIYWSLLSSHISCFMSRKSIILNLILQSHSWTDVITKNITSLTLNKLSGEPLSTQRLLDSQLI